MKKTFLLCIAAVSLLTACSNDDVIDVSATSQQAIGFSTFIDKATRGGETTTTITESDPNAMTAAKLKTETGGFGVFGSLTVYGQYSYGSDNSSHHNIFVNEPVWYDETKGCWTYTNTQYWLSNNSYNFTAMWPKSGENGVLYVDTDDTDGTGDKVGRGACGNLIYELTQSGSNYNAKTDLILARSAKIEGQNAIAGDQTVNFSFCHMLSRVGVKFTQATTNPSNVYLNIFGVTIKSYKKGYISFEQNNTELTKAITQESKYYWTHLSGDDGTKLVDVNVPSSLKQVTDWTINDDNKDKVISNGGSVSTDFAYIIPHEEIAGYDMTISFRIAVYAKVSETDDYIRYPNSLTSIKNTDCYTATVTVPAAQTVMQKGNSYLYEIEVVVDGLKDGSGNPVIKPILFNVSSVSDWDGVTTETIQ